MARKSLNQTLVKYIEGLKDQQRIEIDENKEQIEKPCTRQTYLMDDGLHKPFRLSLMQQVVNQITNMEDPVQWSTWYR